MKLNCRKYRNLVIGTIASVLVLFGMTQTALSTNQDDDIRMPDTSSDSVFIELHVTPDGTHGVTTDGVEMEFDVSTGEFEMSAPREETTTRVIFGSRDRVPDVEPVPDIDMTELEELDQLLKEKEAGKRLTDLEIKRVTGLKLGNVSIEEDDVVKGPLVAVGNIIVRGVIEGDAISYKRITVTATGIITGDATAPDIVKMRGGIIEGDIKETGLPSFPEIDIFPSQGSNVPLIVITSIFAGLLLIGFLIITTFPKGVDRVKRCFDISFVRAFFVGLLFWFSIGPLMALLVLTIIGIPVAAFVLPLATVGGVILGIIGISLLVGEKAAALMGRSDAGKSLKFVYGLFVMQIPWLLMAFLMMSSSDVSQGFATFFMVLAIVIWSIGGTTGVGAVILTRFGTRDCKSSVNVEIHIKNAPPPPTPPPLKTDDEAP